MLSEIEVITVKNDTLSKIEILYVDNKIILDKLLDISKESKEFSFHYYASLKKKLVQTDISGDLS